MCLTLLIRMFVSKIHSFKMNKFYLNICYYFILQVKCLSRVDGSFLWQKYRIFCSWSRWSLSGLEYKIQKEYTRTCFSLSISRYGYNFCKISSTFDNWWHLQRTGMNWIGELEVLHPRRDALYVNVKFDSVGPINLMIF